MKPTIYDVAKKSGVSITTVSRVLNQFSGVRSAKRQAVLEAIAELGYVPSDLARNLATNRTKLIALYLPSKPLSFFESKYFLQFYRGVDRYLSDTDYGLVILNDSIKKNPQFHREPKYYQLVKTARLDGVIFSAVPEDAYFPLLLEQAFPLVYVGKKMTDTSMNVYARYTEYMEEILAAALCHGHKKMLAFTYEFQISRLQSVVSHFSKTYNLPEGAIVVRDINEQWTDYLLNEISENGVTMLIVEPLQSVSLLLGHLFQNGIQVPDDVSILSIEYEKEDGAQFIPTIGCVHVPAYEMGREACRMLIHKLEKDETAETLVFESSLQTRNSLANVDF